DPALNPAAREELDAASTLWLTKARYQYLLRLDAQPLPESRIALLLHLVSDNGASLEEVEAQPYGKRKIIV
ncbi:hypothetical protein ACPDQS_005164, partial [Escherichia coli]